MPRFTDGPYHAWILGVLALMFAAISARPYAGGWNDGSRLAAIESLLERRTLVIDDSIFVRVPPHSIAAGMPPYPADRLDLLQTGTLDKLLINGHFYSDKPLAASVLMAGLYQPFQWLGVPTPSERPDQFIRLMTILTSGLGYAVAVGCLWSLGRVIGLSLVWRLIWLGAFAFATYAPTYVQQMNSGAVQLGIVAVMCRLLVRENPYTTGSLFVLGLLAGLGFLQDFGSGPPLLVCTLGLVAWKTRCGTSIIWTGLGMVPFVVAGIGINYYVGGVWKPLNMYPEYFVFPGSPFTSQNLTGFFKHEPFQQLVYSAAMLFGKKGFLSHQLPLLLLVTWGWTILRRSTHRIELTGMLAWCGVTWVLYALLSDNMGGACCSVRWFVPFLVPGFWLLAEIIRDQPDVRKQFLTLSIGGLILGGLMYWKGPWSMRMVPMFWPVVIATLVANSLVIWRTRRAKSIRDCTPESVLEQRLAA